MISNNFLLGVIHARESTVFQQRIYVKDSHVPYAPSHTVLTYSSVRPLSRLPYYLCLTIDVIKSLFYEYRNLAVTFCMNWNIYLRNATLFGTKLSRFALYFKVLCEGK